jgi:predicted anti-sigma-YlaC factor YlaD
MTSQDPHVGRICREVQTQLPALLAETLPGWRRRLVDRHLRRCERCEAELERQREVAVGLGELGAAAAEKPDTPPEELLSALLERAEHPGMRERAAVPARGAVSGARPALSVALLVAAAVAGTAAGFAVWRGLRAVRRLFGRHGT